MATVTIRPNSDEYKSDLTLSSGTLAYALIDEATLDTGDYVTCAMFGGQLQAGWTDTGLSSETINKVTFYLISSQTGSKDIGHRATSFVRWGSMSHEGEGVWSIEFATNPRTSSAWTVSELDELTCGFLCSDSDNKNTTPVYQFYAVVNYTAGGSAQNLTLSCAAGSYSLAGVACTLTYTPAAQNLTLSCGAGSYSLTGTDVTLTPTIAQNLTLACNAGTLALTGTNADITSSRTLICEPASGGAYPDIIVSGAGSTAYNGTYAVYGARDGKPRYRKATPESASGYAYLVWVANTEQWFISQFGEDAHTQLPIMNSGLYYSNDDTATPDLVTTWTALQGTLPVPTVAAGTSLGYILTGSDVTLTYTQGAQNLTLTCEAGAYTLTGSSVSFVIQRNYSLACEAGAYTLTGSNATFEVKRNYVLTCGAGSYTLTGTDITFGNTNAYTLACGAGSYAITGTNAALTSARTLGCVQGSYILTGLEADLFKGLVMPCGNGSYILTGSPVTINSARTFALGMGSYVLVGTNAGLYKYVQFPYAEVWDGKVVMNLEVNKSAVMNRELDFTYSELESTL